MKNLKKLKPYLYLLLSAVLIGTALTAGGWVAGTALFAMEAILFMSVMTCVFLGAVLPITELLVEHKDEPFLKGLREELFKDKEFIANMAKYHDEFQKAVVLVSQNRLYKITAFFVNLGYVAAFFFAGHFLSMLVALVFTLYAFKFRKNIMQIMKNLNCFLTKNEV